MVTKDKGSLGNKGWGFRGKGNNVRYAEGGAIYKHKHMDATAKILEKTNKGYKVEFTDNSAKKPKAKIMYFNDIDFDKNKGFFEKMESGGWIGSYKKPIKTSDVSEFLNSTKNDGHKYSLWNKEVGVTYAYNGKLYANNGRELPNGTVIDFNNVMAYWKTKNADTLLLEDEKLVVLPEKQDKYNCYTTGYDGLKNKYGNEDNITLEEAVDFCWKYDDVRKKYANKKDLEKEIKSTPYGKDNIIASSGNITGVVVYKVFTKQYVKGGGVGESGEVKDLTKLNNLEDYVFSNLDDIKSNLETYGFINVSKITNPYDLSSLLGVDSRIFKNADVPYYAEFIAGLLKSDEQMKNGGGVGEIKITKNEVQFREDEPKRVYHWYEGTFGDYIFYAQTDNSFKNGYGSDGINKGSVYKLSIRKVKEDGMHDSIAEYWNKWDYKTKNYKDAMIRSKVVKYLDSISDERTGTPKKYKNGGNTADDEDDYLGLVFSTDAQYKEGKKFYDGDSAFYAEDFSDEFRTLFFKVERGDSFDTLEFELERELQETDLDGWYFTQEKFMAGGNTRANRPSPSISATSVSVGTQETGNDGNSYEVKADKNGVQRWVKINLGGEQKPKPKKVEDKRIFLTKIAERKAGDWEEGDGIIAKNQLNEASKWLQTLQIVMMEGESPMDNFSPDVKQAVKGDPFIAMVGKKAYYVDPQGYDYARYILNVTGFDGQQSTEKPIEITTATKPILPPSVYSLEGTLGEVERLVGVYIDDKSKKAESIKELTEYRDSYASGNQNSLLFGKPMSYYKEQYQMAIDLIKAMDGETKFKAGGSVTNGEPKPSEIDFVVGEKSGSTWLFPKDAKDKNLQGIKLKNGGKMNVENCDRCNRPTGNVTTMSMFNEDVICMSCKEKEKQHPDYKKAVDADNSEIKKGNYNFKGIGKPEKMKTGANVKKSSNVNKKYAYFAVGKTDGKIVTGWEIVTDVESLKYYAKTDLEDMDLNPKEFNILSKAHLIRTGINPFDWESWRKTNLGVPKVGLGATLLGIGAVALVGSALMKKGKQKPEDEYKIKLYKKGTLKDTLIVKANFLHSAEADYKKLGYVVKTSIVKKMRTGGTSDSAEDMSAPILSGTMGSSMKNGGNAGWSHKRKK